MITRDDSRFAHGEPPSLLLALTPERLASLPPLARDVTVTEGWKLLAKPTMCVVDGPDDAGFLVQAARSGDEADEIIRWLEQTERAGGCLVIAVSTRDELHGLSPRADAFGGFVRTASGSG